MVLDFGGLLCLIAFLVSSCFDRTLVIAEKIHRTWRFTDWRPG
jgi:hypothetical protein